jgi:ABC-type polysaccharide/polyol phosphate transport system ATPase subunit
VDCGEVGLSHVINLSDAGKQYVKYKDTPSLVTRVRRLRNRTSKSLLWAVRHVDLEVARGECVGVIGRNGSGKSTMLQLVAGTTRPSEGRVRVAGRVAPLISVGVGFHPELTGRENVFINGMILGMSKRDLERQFDSIVDFSEVEAFIDTPVKFYSSGMFVRLGFAVAVHVRPEVLLVDEVLAVGDLAFQLKCFERISEIRTSGATILVVSHNLNAIRRLCDRTLLLHDGRHRYIGDNEEAIAQYQAVMNEPRRTQDNADFEPASRVVVIESMEIIGPDGHVTTEVPGHQQMTVRMRASFTEQVDDPVFGLAVFSDSGVPVYSDNSPFRRKHAYRAGERITCDIVLHNPLAAGDYRVSAGVFKSDLVTVLAGTRQHGFSVSGGAATGVADLRADFKITKARAGVEPIEETA